MKEFKLENYGKIDSGFKVPENYFDGLSVKILERSVTEVPKVIPLYANKTTWMYAAAAVFVMSLSISFYNSFLANSIAPDHAAIENYLAEQPVISEDLLVDLLEKEDIESLDADLNFEDTAIEEALSHNNNLEQYLTN